MHRAIKTGRTEHLLGGLCRASTKVACQNTRLSITEIRLWHSGLFHMLHQTQIQFD